jgi:hypothetical protein
MDSSSRQVLPSVAGPVRPGAHGVRQSGRRRRPSGEAPPLPHHLQTSGVGWLVASVVLVATSIMVFAGGLRGLAVAVTVLDDAVVRWLAGLDAPGLAGTWRVVIDATLMPRSGRCWKPCPTHRWPASRRGFGEAGLSQVRW